MERVAQQLGPRLRSLRPERYRIVRPPPALAHRAGHVWEQSMLPAFTRGFGALFSPANVAPLAARNNVIGVFDAAAVRHPQWYGRVYAWWQGTLLPRLAARARLLVTASSFGRDELVEVLGADPERVAVVPLGVDERFGPAADAEGAARALGLTRPYVLAVGSLIARKNLTVLDLAEQLLHDEGTDLLIAGAGRNYMRADTRLPGRSLGYVADEHLPGLYAGARAVVVPSRYEGFGLPCLEAMASGAPLVAADATALPEVCGDAAWLVDPDDRAGFASAVSAAAFDQRLRSEKREQGLERAASYTWERTARRVDALLDELLEAA